MCQFAPVLDKVPETTKKKGRNEWCHFEVGPTLSSSSALCILTCGVINKSSSFGILNVCAYSGNSVASFTFKGGHFACLPCVVCKKKKDEQEEEEE